MAASVFSGAHTQDPRCAISEILGMVRINAFCFSDKCLVSTFSQAVKRRIIMKAMITSNRKNIYVYFVFMLVGVNIFIVITKIQYIFVYQLFCMRNIRADTSCFEISLISITLFVYRRNF